MAKVKVKRKSTFIDMTAMSDVTVLLLTFFMLTSTFIQKEPVTVTTPGSVSEIKIPESDILQILVDPQGKVFMTLDKQEDRVEVLKKVGEEYGITFTPEEINKFRLANSFGVPISQMKAFLALSEDEQDATLKELGIPTDSTDNQFKVWVKSAREQNRNLRIAIKADQTTPYPEIKTIMTSLQDIRENRYNLITSLKVVAPEESARRHTTLTIMAEIQESSGKTGKSKQKKFSVRVDFTPMVDMNMLLITFFMLCTSLSKPQTMEISMPTNDKVTEEEQTKIKASQAVTLLLGADDKVYYYFGEPNYEDYTSLKETDYSPEGLRAMLLDRNKEVTARINDLKQQKKDEKITEEQFKEQAAEIKKDKNAPTVVIKGTDESSYKNLIDALDEMQICNISRYAIVDITDGDKFLLDNYEQKGELTRNIDR